MMGRILPCLAALLLAGCGEPGAGLDRILCAVGGAAEMTSACTVERAGSPGGTVLTLRHPDGGFRRLLITGDGRGVIAADGAAPATVTIAEGGKIEVGLAGDRYRLPATIKAR